MITKIKLLKKSKHFLKKSFIKMFLRESNLKLINILNLAAICRRAYPKRRSIINACILIKTSKDKN